MSLVILFNDNHFIERLNNDVRRNVPRAVAATLNRMVQIAQKDLKTAEKQHLKLTRPFIQSSTQYEAARSAQRINMQAEVDILDRVKFIGLLDKGGVRTPISHKYIAVPIEAKRNGRVSAGMRPSVILSKPGYFIMDGHNNNKVIAKVMRDHSIKIMYALELKTDYKKAPYLDFDKVVETSAAVHNYPQMIQQALQRSIV